MSYSIKREVHIKRRKSSNLVRYGTKAKADELLMNTNAYVGGGLTSSGEIMRGLTPEEEAKYLPNIVASNPSSPNWEQKVEDYWNNIRVSIPYGEKGKILQIGFAYKNEDTARRAEKEVQTLYKSLDERVRSEGIKSGTLLIKECQIRQKHGEPISLSDYIFYRFCLITNKVANAVDYVNYSPKIAFYIYSKDKDIAERHFELNKRKEVNMLMYELLGDHDKKYQMLRMFGINPNALNETLGEVDLAIEAKAKELPDQFLSYAKDPKLKIKAFIEECIAVGALRRIPNTETVMYKETKLGDIIDDVVFFFENQKNKDTIDEIKNSKSYHIQLARDGVVRQDNTSIDVLNMINQAADNYKDEETPIDDLEIKNNV